MNLLDDDNLNLLFNLSSTVSFVSDASESFRIARKIILDLVPCDTILLLFDDRDRESLIAPIEINDYPDEQTKEVSISYNDKLANAILISRQTVALSLPENPLVQGISHELIIPLISPESVLGCLYFGRRGHAAFSLREKMLAEHIASFIAMPLERLKWEERWDLSRKVSNRWQEKYLSILESMPLPVAVMDLYNDTIDDANAKFLKLIALNRSAVFQKKISELFSIPNLSKHLSENGSSFQEDVQIVAGQDKFSMQAQFTQIKPVSPNKHLVLFNQEKPAAKPLADRSWLPLLFAAAEETFLSGNLKAGLEKLCSLAADRFNPKYITIQRLSAEMTLETVAAYQKYIGGISPLFEETTVALSEGPFMKAIETGKDITLGDVTSSPMFFNWLPVANKVGYKAFASFLLKLQDQRIGLMSLFCQEARPWMKEDVEDLEIFATIISYILYENFVKNEAAEKNQQLAVLDKIIRALGANKDLEEIIKTAAVETQKIVDFDYLSMTLFDEYGHDARIFDIATSQIKEKLNSSWHWEPILETNLGWIKKKIPTDMQEETLLVARPKGMPSSLPAHTSLLLLSRDNYLGNLSLGRITDKPFTRNQITFLRQLTNHIAIALENARLYDKVQKGVGEISALAQASRIISQSLKIEEIQETLTDAIKTALGAQYSKIFIFDERSEPLNLFSWLPENIQQVISAVKLNQLVDALEREQTPAIFDSSEKLGEQILKEETITDTVELSGPFIISPVLHENVLIAAVVVAWEGKKIITENEIEILSTLSGQARGALMNAMLFQRAKLKADELESFVYTVSHDLKSPIQSIRSYINLLNEECRLNIPEGPIDYFQRINANLDQMETLIMDLLDLSRIGRVDTKFQYEDVGEILRAAIDSLAGLYENREIEFDISPDFPRIYYSKVHLMQIFTNLLSNAIKFTKKRAKALIQIGFKEYRSNYQFHVKDNGVGISPELHSKIFDLFHTKTSEDETSSGVGLAIVKKIVELHGGKIWVESEKDQGATLNFTIPKHHQAL